ncbi:hypothetical protein DL771_005869 [Monosporascus sp. 5C6A]|nr:hypothetical protein DL771_005869 [Monosporascus sp. 5C6A]
MANEYARQQGLTMFSVYQGQWSAAERDVEREILPMCNDQGMALIPYGVLGSGSFRTSAQRSAEQRQAECESESGQQKREGRNIAFTDKPEKTVMADALEKIAIAKETSITSVALAWARVKGPYIFPVVGARRVEHLKDSIEALGLELTKDDVEEIEKAVPFDFGYPQTILGGPGCYTPWRFRQIARNVCISVHALRRDTAAAAAASAFAFAPAPVTVPAATPAVPVAVLAVAAALAAAASAAPATPPSVPVATALALPLRIPRTRLARGACRTVPCLGCLRSAFAGRSDGVCYDAVVGSRCWRYVSGPVAARPAAVRLVEAFENGAFCCDVDRLRTAVCMLFEEQEEKERKLW